MTRVTVRTLLSVLVALFVGRVAGTRWERFFFYAWSAATGHSLKLFWHDGLMWDRLATVSTVPTTSRSVDIASLTRTEPSARRLSPPAEGGKGDGRGRLPAPRSQLADRLLGNCRIPVPTPPHPSGWLR